MKNQNGSIIIYLLLISAAVSTSLFFIFSRIDSLNQSIGSMESKLEAELFINNLQGVLQSSLGCSYALGYGYHNLPSSPTYANNFNPDDSTNQPITIRDSAGTNAVIYDKWTGSLDSAPDTSKVNNKLVIRDIYLVKKNFLPNYPNGNINTYAKVDINRDAFSGSNPSPNPLNPSMPIDPVVSVTPYYVDIRSIYAEFVVKFEVINPNTAGPKEFMRKFDMTIYTESPFGTNANWKIATCASGFPNPPAGASVQKIIVSGALNSVTCPDGYYLYGVNPIASKDGITPTAYCAVTEK